ncbi:MAG: choice-of-anchor D domain-containing protein [Persicimonas sp.]
MNRSKEKNAASRGPLASIGAVASVTLLACLMAAGIGCGQHDETSTELDDPRAWGDYEYDGEPEIDAPERVAFNNVPDGTTERREVEVTNVGGHMLELDEWSIDGPFEMEFLHQEGKAPEALRPDESARLRISYSSDGSDEAIEGALTIESNDPDAPVTTVELAANVDFPCMELRPEDELDFGTVPRDEPSRERVRVTNCAEESELEVDVDEIEGDDAFSLADDVEDTAFTLEAGESREVSVSFNPEDPERYSAELPISSNAEEDPDRTIDLLGEGAPYECPKPVIRASHPDRGEEIADPQGHLETVPLDEIALDASLSEDPEGEGIASYEWELVEQPEDSNVGLENTDGEQNELWMQLAGTYEVELQVESELGVRGCDPARLTIEAIAESDVHVQLVWSTPSDSDETDDDGTDLDIHLLHPNGDWDAAPWDCHWKNQNPDWGVEGDESDDPSLDIDDTNGAGPENINLDNPEDVEYEVGVHYFNDHGFGESYATVRVYLGGVLVHEAADHPMTDREFWHAATIDWEAQEVEGHDDVYSDFP